MLLEKLVNLSMLLPDEVFSEILSIRLFSITDSYDLCINYDFDVYD